MAPASIFYRVLKAGDQLIHRQKSKPVRQQQKPQAFIATRPNQIYSCDITYLPTLKRGMFFYVYLVFDIDSCKIIGWQVKDCDSSALVSDMMFNVCHREDVIRD